MKIYFNNLFERIDLFGSNISFLYLKKEKHGSIYGGIITIILYIILCVKLSLYLKKIINKEDLEFKIFEQPTIDDSIKLNNFDITICPVLPFFLKEDFSKYFELTAFISNTFLSKTTEIERNHFKCFNETLPCYCLKFNNDTKYNITSTNNIYEDLYLKINLEVKFKQLENYIMKFNNSTYNIIKDIFFINFNNNYVNTSDYFNLVNSFITNQISIINKGKIVRHEIKLSKLRTNIEDDFFTFGFLDPVSTINDYYTLDSEKSLIHDWRDISDESIIDINILHSKKILIYKINTFSIDSLFSQFGGYIQIFLLLFELVGNMINSYILDLRIQNKLYSNIKDYNKDLIKYNSNIKKNNDNEMKSIRSLIDNTKSIYSKNIININYKKLNKLEYTYLKNESLLYDFKSKFDFDELYNLFKDVCLIKYFLFNSKENNLLKMLNKSELEIKQLDIINTNQVFTSNAKTFDEKISILRDYMNKSNKQII